MCSKVKDEKRGGPRKGDVNPRRLWRSRNRSGECCMQATRASFPGRGKKPCEEDAKYCCSLLFVRIDSFGSQDGDHVPADETCGQCNFR